jgi:hypothetical protein
MNMVSGIPQRGGDNGIDQPLRFFKALQSVTNKIHSTGNVDEIMLDLSQDICDLFTCDRLTIYAISEDKTRIDSKIKTALHAFKDFSLPISEKSIAGYAALTKKLINLRDVYDESELLLYSPGLRFLKKVDQRTKYKTKQLLSAPILNAQTNELLGVVQLINSRNDLAFPPIVEEGVKEFCETLAIAFAQRSKPPAIIKSKYDPLVVDGVLSMPELGLALRSARRKGLDTQEVLVNEFQVKLADVGESLSSFFDVPYEPYREGRDRPSEVLKNLKQDYVEHNHWLPLEENADKLVIMTTDPERVKSSRILYDMFPRSSLSFCVTTNLEFKKTVAQFFGPAVGPSTVQEIDDAAKIALAAKAEYTLINRLNTILVDAFQQEGAADILISIPVTVDDIVTRFREDGELESIKGKVTIEFEVRYAGMAVDGDDIA